MTKTEKQMPDWAKKLDDLGKSWESKLSPKDKKPKYERKGDLLGEIFGYFITILIINYAPKYFPNFFTESYVALLWVMLAVLTIQIVLTFILIIYSSKWFYYLVESGISALGVISAVTAISIFPFNVPYGLGFLFKFALIIGALVAALVALYRLLRSFITVLEDLSC